ncbi:MAG: NAD(P)/FAD-dependent oxidoreductase [Betaproteobacteria bacterium]
MSSFDVAVIGAGAAGMMCAAVAGQRGMRVVLLDHAEKLAEKIRISGGGRCNFTNRVVTAEHFLSANPHFCKSALAGFTPQDFIAMVDRHGIAWHEKHKGQLFCDQSSELIIEMLRTECDDAGVKWMMPCAVNEIASSGDDGVQGFVLSTDQGQVKCRNLVIATGGLAIPQLGATDFGLKIARQFGIKVIEPRPALVPLTFNGEEWQPLVDLAGLAIPSVVSTGTGRRTPAFLEDVLFTHKGLSGPGILQISSYWQPGEQILLDLAPDMDMEALLLEAKAGGRQQLGTLLASLWPKRLSEQWLGELAASRIADLPDRTLRELAARIKAWAVIPNGTLGYKKAEVMRGGVDTHGLDQRTMQAKAIPGLHFIGEVVDVTGWLGGYNFQWAWASAAACGRGLI